ncbi:TPA: hypothetical protein WI316_001594 [Neisseria meningitidis]|uniref:hypothetical protein n=1 Tax=Neisseria meningitidis TaxID=487 RepID=UPI001C59A05E|nr:hypothetical protein [Neisseria meningitidis]MBW3932856.1 hypothetical protein [Neisseria meningitidis]
MQAAFCFSDDLHQRLLIQVAFQTACNRKICRNLLPPLWGRVGERAFSKLRQSPPPLKKFPNRPKYKPYGLLPSL